MIGKYLPLVALALLQNASAFSLYPTIDPDKLASLFGVSTLCIEALNATVTCDADTFQMASSVDNYYWSTDNVTALCTAGCQSSAKSWSDNVASVCLGQTITVYGRMVPVDSIPGRYVEGLSIACLEANNTWCLLASQDWTGSEIIRPDCTASNATHPACTDPTSVSAADERIANLYQDEMLCDACFLSMFYQRLSSPYLPDADYSDYLVAQFQDIQDVCSTQLPSLTTRALPAYPTQPAPTGIFATTNKTAVCHGQSIHPVFGKRDLAYSNGTSILSSCNSLSIQYGVTTGDLNSLMNAKCQSNKTVCAPLGCELQQVPASATCDSLAQLYSTASLNITTYQFQTWNPNIMGLCDSVTEGQYVCAGPPGGSLVPPKSNSTANPNNQQPGYTSLAVSGNTTSTATASYYNTTVTTSISTTATSSPSSTSATASSTNACAAAPGPTQSGIACSCVKFAMAKSGDTCMSFASANGITTDELYSWNAVLGIAGSACSTELWISEYYCVGISSTSSSSPSPSSVPRTTAVTSTTTSTPASIFTTTTAQSPSTSTSITIILGSSTTATAPGPTQSGITPKCTKYAEAQNGDTCTSFATTNGITTDELYAWNTVLGAGGSACSSELWADEYYCVGVAS